MLTGKEFPGGYSKAITRGQMAHVFASALPESELTAINLVNTLPDVNASTPYSKDIFLLYRAGVLTGVYRTLPQFSPNDTRVTFYDYFKKPKFSRIQALLKTMDEIAAAHHATPAQVAINWSTQKDFVDTAILGFSKPSHAVQNCAALDWALSSEELACLDRAIALHLEGAEKSEEAQ